MAPNFGLNIDVAAMKVRSCCLAGQPMHRIYSTYLQNWKQIAGGGATIDMSINANVLVLLWRHNRRENRFESDVKVLLS